MRLAARRITSSATHFIAPTHQLSHHAFARAGIGASVDGLVERARGGNCRREFSREMTSVARACANGRPSGQKNDFVGRVRARSGRWTSRGRPVRSDKTSCFRWTWIKKFPNKSKQSYIENSYAD